MPSLVFHNFAPVQLNNSSYYRRAAAQIKIEYYDRYQCMGVVNGRSSDVVGLAIKPT